MSNSDVVINSNTSLAHGCIVHGPCILGEGCFVGFGSVVFDCILGSDSIVLHNATVRKVTIPPGKVIPDGMSLTVQESVDSLEGLSPELEKFKQSVIKANVSLVNGYKNLAMEA
nr:hypothetical protein [Methanolobus chelungpuianus]